MVTHQQGHKSQFYENVGTPKHVSAYIFYCGDCKPLYFSVVTLLVKDTHMGTFWYTEVYVTDFVFPHKEVRLLKL